MEEDISNPQTGSTSVCDYVFGSLKLLVIDVIKPGSCRTDTWRISVRGKMLFFCSMPLLKSNQNPSTSYCCPLKTCFALPHHYLSMNRAISKQFSNMFMIQYSLIMCSAWDMELSDGLKLMRIINLLQKNLWNSLHFSFSSLSMSI